MTMTVDDPWEGEESERELLSGQAHADDLGVEATLRPQRIDDYVGQSKITENLRVFIQAAKARGESLDMTASEFYEHLAAEMIDMTIVCDCRSVEKQPPSSPGVMQRPTKRCRAGKPHQKKQGPCVVCKKSSTHVCDRCSHWQAKKECHVCDQNRPRDCWFTHLERTHG